MAYESVTRSIRVIVEPSYLAEQSAPDEGLWFWAYTVELINEGEETVQLRQRYWKITDATGRVQEVRGRGVVGEEPVLRPGERFNYTSGCPLPTSSGIMSGAYTMQNSNGEMFDIEIPAFSLDVPAGSRALN